jgi:hypothetical protein
MAQLLVEPHSVKSVGAPQDPTEKTLVEVGVHGKGDRETYEKDLLGVLECGLERLKKNNLHVKEFMVPLTKDSIGNLDRCIIRWRHLFWHCGRGCWGRGPGPM